MPNRQCPGWTFVILLVGCCLSLVGCAPEQASPSRGSKSGGSEASTQAAPKPISSSAKESAEVDLKVVTYDELVAAVKAQKGKVVVIDAWATFCPPCMREFPNLVQMHKDFAKDGLVCMSVTIDELEQKDAALRFLRSKNATFANYLLNEDAAVWQTKWQLKGVPAVFVFGKDGQRAAKFDNDDDHQFTYEDVRNLVVKLLGKEQKIKAEQP